MANGWLHGFCPTTWAVVCMFAFGGLLVAIVIRFADNNLKNLAMALGAPRTGPPWLPQPRAQSPAAMISQRPRACRCIRVLRRATYGGAAKPIRLGGRPSRALPTRSQ